MLEQSKTGAGSPMGVNDFLRTARNLGRLIDDPEALGQAMAVVEAFEQEIAAAALRLKAEGYSYADLGRANGVTDARTVQALHQNGRRDLRMWRMESVNGRMVWVDKGCRLGSDTAGAKWSIGDGDFAASGTNCGLG